MVYRALINFKAGPGLRIKAGDVYQGERLEEFVSLGFVKEEVSEGFSEEIQEAKKIEKKFLRKKKVK